MKKGVDDLKDELCGAIQKDLGKEAFVSFTSEIHLLRTDLQHSIDHLKDWMKPEHVDTPIQLSPGASYIEYEPLGVACVMGAWNFPLYTLMAPA